MKKTFFLSLLVLFFACNKGEESNLLDLKKKAKNSPDATIFNFKTHNLELGRVVWELDAKEAHHFEKKRKSQLKTLEVFYYEENKEVLTHIISDHGTIFKGSKDIVLQTNVVVISSNGTRLESDYLKWNNDAGVLSVPMDYLVKIIRPNGDEHQGNGMKANKSLETVEFLSNASGDGFFQEEIDEGT